MQAVYGTVLPRLPYPCSLHTCCMRGPVLCRAMSGLCACCSWLTVAWRSSPVLHSLLLKLLLAQWPCESYVLEPYNARFLPCEGCACIHVRMC